MSANSGSSKSKPKSDKVSYNSRAILVGLFVLVAFILLVFAVAVNWFPSEGIGRLNTVFVAAISGSLALGGTLISQLWGRGDETNSPIVYSKFPADGADGVPLDTEVSALFNKTMNGNTINKQTFFLKEEKSESNIDATVRLDGGSAILKPVKPLGPSTPHVATMSKSVRDIEGNAMDSDVSWSFKTGIAAS